MTYSCLHCPARGISCPECEGLGTVEDVFEPDDDQADLDPYALDAECPTCLGWGIVEVVPTPKPTRKPKRKGGGS
jgi:hypothetical protein